MGDGKRSSRARFAGLATAMAVGSIAFPGGALADAIVPHTVAPRPVTPHVVLPPPATEPAAGDDSTPSSAAEAGDVVPSGDTAPPPSAPPTPPRPIASDELPTPQQQAAADAEDRYVRRFYCGAVNAIMTWVWGNAVLTGPGGVMAMGDVPQAFGAYNSLSNAIFEFNRYCANWRSG